MEWSECDSGHFSDELGNYWLCDIGVVPNRWFVSFVHPEGHDMLIGKVPTLEDAMKLSESHNEKRTGAPA